MATTKDLKKLLRDSNYEVRIESTKSGAIASFPVEFGEVAYLVTENGVILHNEEIELPAYSIRVFILYDLLVKCKAINYQPGLICMIVNNEEVDEDTLFYNIPSPNKDETSEVLFKELMIYAAKNNFNADCDHMASEYTVYDGYSLFKKIFEDQEII